MIVASVVMMIIAVNMTITILIIKYVVDLILDRLKIQDKFDGSVEKHICTIYDIITYNGLVKPRRNEYDKGSESNNQKGHKEVWELSKCDTRRE